MKKMSTHNLLTNNENNKIITTIKKELLNCDSFEINVAFITESGITLILNELQELQEKGIKGKIITGDYLNFTTPEALKKLMSFKNIKIKLNQNGNLHAKGYLFSKEETSTLIIGSTNITQTALTTNQEWNTMSTVSNNDDLYLQYKKEFLITWNQSESIEEVIEGYEKKYRNNQIQLEIQKKQLLQKNKSDEVKKHSNLVPNLMQKNVLLNLSISRNNGENKGLIISATGTGKTIVSALDVKVQKPKKLLFLVHRELIAQKACTVFSEFFPQKKCSVFNKKLTVQKNDFIQKIDYYFATIQTIGKTEFLKLFNKKYFDYIIIDEVHHIGAKIYQNLINYFEPKFLLGMTATPLRTDGIDIYKYFNYNTVSQFYLHDALKAKIIVPFHYFGIKDIVMEEDFDKGQRQKIEINETTTIKNLTIDNRVQHILEKSNFYGYSGKKLHALIFVSQVEEGKVLAQKISKVGINATFLGGMASDKKRKEAIKDFERGMISYIITVDIFNEGIDIPCVNQVILLRPTKSAIIYIQQLGRGLRKNLNKEFVVILDFIGNYKNNFLIPIALSQNNSYQKDDILKFLITGSNDIPGETTITFEKVIREELFTKISNLTKLGDKQLIKSEFNNLYQKTGDYPLLCDFQKHNSLSAKLILEHYKSMIELYKENNIQTVEIDKSTKNAIEFLSQHFTQAKRLHEFYILKILSDTVKNEFSIEYIVKNFISEYNIRTKFKENIKENFNNALEHLTKNKFANLSSRKKYQPLVKKKLEIVTKNKENKYELNFNHDNIFFQDILMYNLNYAYENYPINVDKETDVAKVINSGDIFCGNLKLHSLYNKSEAFHYLNLEYSNGYQVRGYTIFEEEKKGILFINFFDEQKNEYDNQLLTKKTCTYFFKNRELVKHKKLTKEGQLVNNKIESHLFARFDKSKEYYYLGEIINFSNIEEKIDLDNKKIIKCIATLKYEIMDNIYEYLKRKK